MPPCLPTHNRTLFQRRSLSPHEIGTMVMWVNGGEPEGAAENMATYDEEFCGGLGYPCAQLCVQLPKLFR